MITQNNFDKYNSTIKEFIIKNEETQVNIINYGGIITKFVYDDIDVALGYDTLNEYLNTKDYYGATIGRVCNRIAYGRFELNGKEYQLTLNDGENSLHGGKVGFNKKVFDYEINGDKLILSYLSKDGEEGYPANLLVKVIYYLDKEGLHIDFEGTSDNDTICNLTNHTFFNLNGNGNGDILNHKLQIAADYILPINSNFVPTGATMSVENSPFDFRQFHIIGERVNEENDQLKFGRGYDHAFVLNGEGLRKIATLVGDKTNLKLDVITDQKSIQFYGGNFLCGDIGKNKKLYIYRSAVCLETQGYPNAINCKVYPSVILKKGETYVSKTIYKLYK